MSQNALSREDYKKLETPDKIRFAPKHAFTKELQKRVSAYFKENKLPKTGGFKMFFKTLIVLSWFVASYGLMVFTTRSITELILLSISLGLSIASLGFNVMHDGSHKAYSKNKIINKIMGSSLDVLGGSSYYWHWKHNYLHHSFSNITSHDDDVNVGFLGRLTPHQPHYFFHRLQHLYMWFFYGLLPVKWHFIDDFVSLLSGRIGEQKVPRPKGMELVGLFVGKVLFAVVAFVIPSLFFPLKWVFAFYVLVSFVEGVALAVTFQMAHCVEGAEFPMPDKNGYISDDWAIHQIKTTVDFSHYNPLVRWYVGGLNYQIEHHLFPRVCHLHYPALSKIVRETCEEFDLPYNENTTMFKSLRAHYRLLHQLSKPTPA